MQSRDFKPILSNSLPKLKTNVISNHQKFKHETFYLPSILLKSKDYNKISKSDIFLQSSGNFNNVPIRNIQEAKNILTNILNANFPTDDKLRDIKMAYEDYINLLENDFSQNSFKNNYADLENINLSNGEFESSNMKALFDFTDEADMSDKNKQNKIDDHFIFNLKLNSKIENLKLKGIELLNENKRLRSELRNSYSIKHKNKTFVNINDSHVELKNDAEVELKIKMVHQLKREILLKLKDIEEVKNDIRQNYVPNVYVKHLNDNLADIISEREEDQSSIYLLEKSIKDQTIELKEIFHQLNVTEEDEKSIWDSIDNRLENINFGNKQSKTSILTKKLHSEPNEDDESYKWNWYIS